jgi:hypothetical protein
MSKYKLIQTTNQNLGAVAVNDYMPFGNITRRLNASTCNCDTFNITSTGSNILYLNEPGYYKVTYSANLVAGAVGDLTTALVVNGTNVYQVLATAAEGDTYNVTLPYVIRVCPNSCANPANCPVSVQIQLLEVAITGGSANLIVEKIG